MQIAKSIVKWLVIGVVGLAAIGAIIGPDESKSEPVTSTVETTTRAPAPDPEPAVEPAPDPEPEPATVPAPDPEPSATSTTSSGWPGWARDAFLSGCGHGQECQCLADELEKVIPARQIIAEGGLSQNELTTKYSDQILACI